MNAEQLFENMWQNYLELNPQAQQIFDLFSKRDKVVNDHIAFRTYGVDGLRVEDIARPFLENGYREMESYDFPEKKLRAKHYAHDNLPLIFISELMVEAFSPQAQAIITKLTNQVTPEQIAADDFIYAGRPWQLDYADYQTLLTESEYAAWVAAFGYRPNHFTVAIHELEQFDNIQQVNQLLLDNGFTLNTSGGLIKGTPEQYLEQSATMANQVEVQFNDRIETIPSCFYEFAMRHKLPNGQLYKGFIAANADKIFESTNKMAA